MASAQLSYRLDANSNSYTLQTPNSQTHFTQYFNGQGAGGAADDGQNLARYQQAQNQQQVCSWQLLEYLLLKICFGKKLLVFFCYNFIQSIYHFCFSIEIH